MHELELMLLACWFLCTFNFRSLAAIIKATFLSWLLQMLKRAVIF